MKNKYLILILTCIFYLGANSQNNVTFQVDMNTVDPTTFTTPEVNGTFNGWCGNCAAMSDLDGDNIWDVTIDLANGTYEFKYSADNWTIQESLFSGDSCTNGNTQYTNRMLTVSGDTTLPVVCWSSCSSCNSGPSSYNVTFEVDMRGVTDPHNTPEVNGDFNSWCGNCWQMTDTDGDSIWQFTTSFSEDTIEWKYSADNWNIQEELDSNLSCITINYDPSAPNGWGFVNRLAVINSDTTFSSAWESCEGLGGGTGNPLSQIDLPITWDDTTVDYTVTDFGGNSSSLSVDPLDPTNHVIMSDKTAGAQTWAGTTLSTPSGLLSSIPFVSGSTTISAHVYSPNAGTVVRLKAEDHTDPTKSVETEATTTVAGSWNTLVFDFANEAPGTAMIDFTYNYDMLSIFYDFGNNGVGDVYYLDSVAFGGLVGGTPGCTDPLASNYNPLATIDDGSCLYSTTFNVDMNCEPAGSFGYVHLESPVFGWCGGCVPMSDPDGDGVHSVTVDLAAGNFEYKYAVDGWAGQEDLVDDMLAGGTCAPLTDYSSYANRELLVTAGVSTNDTYGSCDPCITPPPVTTSYTINSGSYYYNPNYLVINVGDTVTWMNDGGYHDVNGNINSQTGVSFGNPVSFYLPPVSGPAVIGSYIFTVAGLYDYDCSIGNHAANGMTGTILVNSLPLSQIDLPITWDDTTTVDYTVIDFGGNSSNLSVDPIDSTNIVLMSDKTAGAQSWAGTTLGNTSLASSIPFSFSETIITAKVFSPVSGINIRLKAEDHTNSGISVETEVTLSTANAWTTLVFDFSNEVAGTAPINFANTYDMLSIFYDFGNVPASSTVFYLDSVEFIIGGTITGCTDPAALNYDPLATLDDGSCTYTWTLSQIDLPVSWDDSTVDYTVSDFGGNSSSLSVDPLNPLNNVLMSEKTSGAQTWAGTTLGTPIGFATPIPFTSGATVMTAHVYSPNAGTVVRLKAEDHTDPTKSVETEATTTVSAGWNTLVFDFANEAPGTAMIDFTYTYDQLSIFYDFGNNGVGDVYYLDSVVFGGLVGGTPGCTDPNATNYDPLATIDDGSCTYAPSLSQIDLPITWDDTTVDYTVTDFGGNNSLLYCGPFPHGCLLSTNKDSSAQTWAGTTLSTPSGLANPIPFISGATVINTNIWTNAPVGTIVRLKAEDHTDPTRSVETEAITTVSAGWNTLVFDFTNEVSGTAQIDFSYSYDLLSIFYNFGSNGDNSIVYDLDSVYFGGSILGIPGCTDPLASNYDSLASIDDGSCLYSTTFNVDMNCEPAGSFGYVHLESPVFGWCGGCVPMSDPDGDGVHSVTVDLAAGNFEYKYAVDGWAGQEDLVDDMLAGGTCAPITDYSSYANRLVTVAAGLSTSDTYGSCNACVLGCTDSLALNYNPLATSDDGTCNYTLQPMVDLFFSEYAEGSSYNKYFEIYNPTSDTIDLSQYAYPNVSNAPSTPGVYEYWNEFDLGAVILPNDVYVVAHPSSDSTILAQADETFTYLSNGDDGFGLVFGDQTSYQVIDWLGDWNGDPGSGWEVAGISNATKDHTLVRKCDVTSGDTSWTNSAGTDSLNSQWLVYPQNTWTYLGSHVSPCAYIYGCTDPLAFNYDSLATFDDGSCIPFVYGCTDSTAINFYPGANTDDGSCIYSGCTDPLANNYDPIATIDDGSCTYMNCSDPSPTGLSNNWVTDTKAEITWDNMNDSACMVFKYFVRYREVGTLTWTTKSAGVGNGLCNFGLNTTTKTLQNLTSATTYEYKMKAFYCGGTESNYSAPSQFTTAADCPPMSNLTATTFNGNQSKVRFDWDSTGAYVFARVALRVDTVGANWQTAGGFGVYYPTLTVNKFGLQSGESYRAQGRTFCDSNITSYRSWWTAPIFWTQPGTIRMGGGTTINNLNVYPNPTNDIFNVSFVSEEIQTLSIRVLNIVGEVVYTENLEQFVGEYTKQISIGNNARGVYFLEITDNQGTINKKIIVQ